MPSCATTSPEQAKANLAYITHAANVLPEMAAAAKHLQQNWGKNLTEPMARLKHAVVKTEAINLRNTIAGQDHRAYTVQPPRAT